MSAIDMTKIYGNKTYKGKWVAVEGYQTNPNVVASGKTLKEAMEKAQKKGFKLPLMMQIPKKILPFAGGYFNIVSE